MNFVDYFIEDTKSSQDIDRSIDQQPVEEFTKQDLYDMIDILDLDEVQEVGELIMELLYDPDDSDFDPDFDSDIELGEKQYFKTRAHQVNKEKKKDKSTKRKLAKKRKLMYKRNKSKIKRKQKLYRKKVKRNPIKVKHHR